MRRSWRRYRGRRGGRFGGRRPNPLILGHRGYSARCPENTLSSFRAAFAAGADGIECDVQKTADGRYAVIHDPDLKRVAGVQRSVAELNLTELQGVDLGEGERVPELEQLLFAIPNDRLLDLELKTETLTIDDCPKILAILDTHIDRGRLMVSSFSSDLLFPFMRAGVMTGLLIGKYAAKLGIFRLALLLARLRPQFINFPIQAYKLVGRNKTGIIVRFLRLIGFRFLFWTVNEKSDFERVSRIAEAIATDDVSKALGFLS